MEIQQLLCVVFLLAPWMQQCWATEEHVTVVVGVANPVAETDTNFLCATLDWWPHDKCDYHLCPWHNSSVLNLDLSRPSLAKAIRAFGNLRIRVGGSLQDQVGYGVGIDSSKCLPFKRIEGGLFGFSQGCLSMKRWDELNLFFNLTRAIVSFGLNALHGRHKTHKNHWVGDWNHSNAYSFIKYTISKRYEIDSWEFGNELSGNGVGASVGAAQYGKDLIRLKGILRGLYNNSNMRASLIAPGGFYDNQWFSKFLEASGRNTINAVTHHIYNLGAGYDPRLISRIMDPSYLSQVSKTFRSIRKTVSENAPWASIWVGEAGGAYNSGGYLVSDAFVNSFWYLDQLGMSAKYGTKVYCRQSLIGGNYGLINSTTYIPNPDYYSALLWNRVMGKKALQVQYTGSPYLRVYAHCSKGREGVTLLLINLSGDCKYTVRIERLTGGQARAEKSGAGSGPHKCRLRRAVSWVGRGTSGGLLRREEYHLAPMDGDLQSRTALLNGKPLGVGAAGDVPALDPVHLDANSSVSVSPLSIAFVLLPNLDAPACTSK